MRKRLLSLALALAACLSLTVAAQAATTFSDVPANHWAYSEIQRCCDQGIVNGYSNGAFGPRNSVTGAHFAAMLTRMFYPEELAANSGLSGQGWYMPALTAASEAGLLDGTSRLESGQANNWKSSASLPLNRYDMAQLLNNILVSKGVQSSSDEQNNARSAIKDFGNIPSKYRSAVLNCYALGVLTGMSNGTFSGSSTMNRAQACVVINRTVNHTGGGSGQGGTQTPSTPTGAKTPEQLSAEVVTLVNQERAKVGLKPLGTINELTAAANIRAPELSTLFEHTRPDGSECFTALKEANVGSVANYSLAGENIARGASTAEGVMNMWMNSAGHKANILHKNFTHIGVAYQNGYWVQMFISASSVSGGNNTTANQSTTLKMTPAALTLEVGKTATVKAAPATGTSSVSVSYTSSNPSVATVSSTGTVTAKKAGTAVITGAATISGKRVTATCTVTVTAAGTQTGTKTPQQLSAEVVTLVNQERAKQGLPALGTLSELTAAAEIRAPELPKLFEHKRPDGRDCFTALKEANVSSYYTAGENIAVGATTAEGVMDMWMNSAGHKANILHKNFTHIGVAYHNGYWVQMFIGSNAGSGSNPSQTSALQMNPATLTLEAGKTGNVKATLSSGTATISYTSSNSAIASVDRSGKVTAKKAGTVVITASATVSGKRLTATCAVTVTDNRTLQMNPATLTLEAGKTGSVKATLSSGTATVSYTSSNSAIASVDRNGKVTAKKAGSAIITASATVGGKRLTATCTVTVTDKAGETPGGTQSLEQMSADIVRMVNEERAKVGLKALSTMPTLTAAANIRAPELNQAFSHTRPDGRLCDTAFAEAGVTNYYNWGENVAMSSDAKRAMTQWMNSPGHRENILTADFTHIGVSCVKNSQGGSYYFVQMFISSRGGSGDTGTTNPGQAGTLTMSPTTLELEVGKTGNVKATASAGSPTISYTSSNASVASVDRTGKVTAKKAGSAVITASATISGKRVTAQCTVTVTADYKLTMSPSTLELEAGKTGSVKAVYDGGYASIRYTSSNPNVATVDNRGNVTAKKAGTAVITASTTALGKDLTATCTVTVTAPVEQQPSKTPEQLCAEVVTLVNQERAKQGLPALGTMSNLTAAAEIRAPELPRLFEHTRPDGSQCFTALDEANVTGYYTAGENIAMGARTAEDVMNMWMNSSGHRRNILSSDFTHIGVAYYNGYWVQMFIGSSGGSQSGGNNQTGGGNQSGNNNQTGSDNPSGGESQTGGGLLVRHTSSSVPSDGLTNRYREDWGDGEYFEISVSGNSVYLTGRMLQDRYDSYDHILLKAYGYGNEDYTTFVSGQTFSLSVDVDMDDFGSWYAGSHTPSPVTIFACSNYTPHSSAYSGNYMNTNHEVALVTDDNGALSLKVK